MGRDCPPALSCRLGHGESDTSERWSDQWHQPTWLSAQLSPLPSTPHPHCLPTTLTFSSGAQAFLRAYPKDRGSTHGEGLLSDSLSSSEEGDQGGHRSQPSAAPASAAGDSRFLGDPFPLCWQSCPEGIERSLGSTVDLPLECLAGLRELEANVEGNWFPT